MFAGLSDREIAEAVIVEMRRRGNFGCVYMLPANGVQGVFGSSLPKGLLVDSTVSQQLQVFAEVAAHSVGEKSTLLGTDDSDTSFDPKDWVN